MAQRNVNIRMDENMKKAADILFQELGLNMSSAVNAFIRQALRQRGMPFDISLNVPNAETVDAMEDITNNKNLSKSFDSISKLMEDLNA